MLKCGLNECPCKRKKCERHSNCDECIEHHNLNEHKGLPYCERKKTTKKEKQKS